MMLNQKKRKHNVKKFKKKWDKIIDQRTEAETNK